MKQRADLLNGEATRGKINFKRYENPRKAENLRGDPLLEQRDLLPQNDATLRPNDEAKPASASNIAMSAAMYRQKRAVEIVVYGSHRGSIMHFG